jgi:hypothetical protein
VKVNTLTGLPVTNFLLPSDPLIMMCGHRCRGVHLYDCVEEGPHPIGIVVKTTFKNFVSLEFEIDGASTPHPSLSTTAESLLISPMNQQKENSRKLGTKKVSIIKMYNNEI